ncbi:MAG TPA: cytochrome c3 family protein [Haliangiales bacterium]|nr:cytochrome c3 family protein [Haliangiales bacterium]
MRARWPFLAIVSLAAGAASAELGRPAPSPVIYPRQTIPLWFSHAQHLAGGAACEGCHVDAAASTRAADDLIPAEKVCAGCHPIDRAVPDKEVEAGAPDAKCSACHPGWSGAGEPPRVVIPPASLKFNHKVHADRGIACQTCHGDLLAQGVGLATRNDLPRMPLCLTCHDGRAAPDACTTCHLGTPKGMIRTELPDGTLVPSGTLRGDAHDLRFRLDHARAAQNDARYCESCHEKRWCLDCHNGVVKPFDFHGNDYVRLHTTDARRNSTSCTGCHRLQTFCVACHARSGVSDDPRTSEYQRLSLDENAKNRYHPDGWFSTFDPNMRRGSHHSFEATRNIRACASCHRENFCLDCHAQKVNPHPPGFGATARCRALAARAGRTCLRCHLRVEGARCD